MKAVVYKKYGPPDTLQLEEVDKPIPKDNEVLIEVVASSVNVADLGMLTGKPFVVRFFSGLFKPKNPILGSDVSGIVKSIGKNVSSLKIGDEVFGDIYDSGAGGYAEYVCAAENLLVLKPSSITFEEAAAVPVAAVTALQALQTKGKIMAKQQVLINGASGGVGSFLVQIAKSFGAEVTAVCSSRNIDMAIKLGADYVIDYTKEDFTKNKMKYDLIIGANGFHSIWDYKRSLTSRGKYVMTGGTGVQMFQAIVLAPFLSIIGKKKLGSLAAKANKNDLTFLAQLMETRKLVPYIEKAYKLSEIINAFKYISEGHAKGKIVINIK
ncbi:MAG: Alcohol dehydrogenase [Candidatus Izimaplasma bacterium HR2]|nr:MAG: Alcohol dehydrogenase [Candidatus Izimaplasma bacterium HR2]